THDRRPLSSRQLSRQKICQTTGHGSIVAPIASQAEEDAMAIQQNFIAGEWVGGGDVNRDINPSNTADIVGEYARADRADAERAGYIFKFFAGEALRVAGEKIASVRPGVEVEMTREPAGIVALITPWNFPIAIPAWKIAPALAYGNCVVFKPADLVPGSAWAIADILVRAGVPAGVFNLVMGRGSVVGETFVNHPDVAAISFTGSVSTGR